MTAKRTEAAVIKTPLVVAASVPVVEVMEDSPSVVAVAVAEVVTTTAIDSQVDDEAVVAPNEWDESQTVQTVADEQVVHPVPQAVHAPREVAEAAVVKKPAALHSHAKLVVPTSE